MAPSVRYGAVRTLWGPSTVLGTWLLIPRLFARLRLAYFLSWGLTGIAFCRIGLTPHLITALVWVFIGALSSPVVHVALDSQIGTRVDTSLRGGVFAIQRLVMTIVNLVGLFFITEVIRQRQPEPGLSEAGVAMGTTAVMGWLVWTICSKRVRYQKTEKPDHDHLVQDRHPNQKALGADFGGFHLTLSAAIPDGVSSTQRYRLSAPPFSRQSRASPIPKPLSLRRPPLSFRGGQQTDPGSRR